MNRDAGAVRRVKPGASLRPSDTLFRASASEEPAEGAARLSRELRFELIKRLARPEPPAPPAPRRQPH